MTISHFIIISTSGDVLLSRNLRNETVIDTEKLYNYLKSNGNMGPVFELDGMLYFFIKRSSLYFVMTTRYITSPSYFLELLQKITNHLKDFIGLLSEESIKNNFVLAYEILDEILDYGYIQCIDVNQLKQKIYNSSTVTITNVKSMTGIGNRNMVPSVVSNKSLINPNNKNEIFVDILEKISSTMSSSSSKYTLEGQIQVKSYLKGSPSVELYLSHPTTPKSLYNLPSIDYTVNLSNTPNSMSYDFDTERTGSRDGFESSRFSSSRTNSSRENEISNCTYDETVDVIEVECDKILKFVPKQGEYTLMTYKVQGPLILPFKIIPTLNISNPKTTLNIKIISCLPNDINSFFLLTCKLPLNIKDIQMSLYPKYFNQICDYKLNDNSIYWNVKKIQGYNEVELYCDILFNDEINNVKQFGPINLMFEIPLYNISHLKIKYLNIVYGNNYNLKSFKWVRYLTISNSYVYRF